MNQVHTRVSLWVSMIALSLAAITTTAAAQTAGAARQPKIDFALTFAADRTNAVRNSDQWLTGGSAELGAQVWRGFGIAAKVTGLTTSSIGSQAIPLNLVITTFGPRYRISRLNATGRGMSIYGEGLIGEANGFKSAFASSSGVTESSNAFASQVGGGFDYNLTSRIGLRIVDADWMRTQSPNGTTNVQNHLELGTGIVLRF
jgi:hypothetical protein